jgi:hypothetical protein
MDDDPLFVLFERYIKLCDQMPSAEEIETDPDAIWTARLLRAEMRETLDAADRTRRSRSLS